MDRLELLADLATKEKTKMVLLVLDGLGGLPGPETDLTELEHAPTPNLDRLAQKSELGLTRPVGIGITPGSGPAHMALFGYEPLKYNIGRGVLSGLGVDFPLKGTDLAARLNFCSLDDDGKVSDRRAGRIPTEKGQELCRLLQEKVRIPGVEVSVLSEKEYRAVAVFRGGEFSGDLADSDPQETGLEPLRVQPRHGHDDAAARRAADVANQFQDQAREILKGHHPANAVLMRGFARRPEMPEFPELYQLRAACIAVYPMYRGLARLVGMDVVPPPNDLQGEVDALKANWDAHDFFFVHVKPTDSAGEDGNYSKKCTVIEQVDALLPQILDLKPDVLVITGDHSTPSQLKAHSWHPVPYLLHSPYCRYLPGQTFGETSCLRGSLGIFPAVDSMALMMAHAGRLKKFGA